MIQPDVYSFFAVAGDSFQIDIVSSEFDPTLRVVGPDAAIALFSDDVVGLNPSLFFTAADSGFYLAIVSSFSGNAPGGAYTLTMSALRNSTLDVQDAGESREGESSQRGYNESEAK